MQFPSATSRRQLPQRLGIMPDVSCVMSHNSFQSIDFLRRTHSIRTHCIDKISKGKEHFAQVGYLGWPVVHLDIDVDMIVGAPGRIESVGPYALKVSRKVARTGTAYQQVTAELVIELNQVRIGIPVLHCSYPCVGGEVVPVA